MLKEMLKKIKDTKAEIKILEREIQFYQELLTKADLSEYEFYKENKFRFGISYKSMIYSEVEKLAFQREVRHKLNHEIVKEILNTSRAKLKIKQRQVSMILEAMNSLTENDKFIIECKYLHSMKYIQIQKNYQEKFKFFLDKNTIIRRATRAIKHMEVVLRETNIFY